MELGILAGFPMIDVKVTVFDGSYHDTDSNEVAFISAGSIAFKEAARKASPVLLEPVMAAEIAIPEQLAAAVKEDINARRGRIKKMDIYRRMVRDRSARPARRSITLKPSWPPGILHALRRLSDRSPPRRSRRRRCCDSSPPPSTPQLPGRLRLGSARCR